MTFEELAAALGGNKVGDRVDEIRFSGLNARKKAVEDTNFTVEDMHPATNNAVEENDIFDDSDEL